MHKHFFLKNENPSPAIAPRGKRWRTNGPGMVCQISFSIVPKQRDADGFLIRFACWAWLLRNCVEVRHRDIPWDQKTRTLDFVGQEMFCLFAFWVPCRGPKILHTKIVSFITTKKLSQLLVYLVKYNDFRVVLFRGNIVESKKAETCFWTETYYVHFVLECTQTCEKLFRFSPRKTRKQTSVSWKANHEKI